jgi:predicted RNA methylase
MFKKKIIPEFILELRRRLVYRDTYEKMYPFNWILDVKRDNFTAGRDDGFPFVQSDSKKIYFQKHYRYYRALNAACFTAVEMDLCSPHRYVTGENKIWGTIERMENEIPAEIPFFVEKGDIVADIGASCGNFSISVVENAKHIYLFECDENWNDPLQKTFENYKDKVTIVNKYVSDADGENSVTLDTFFKDRDVNFIKADVEGYEQQLLNGAKNLLSARSNIKCSICTYHKPQDAHDFELFFKELGYKTYFTDNHLFCTINNTPQNTSFLRKGIIRAWKK